MNSVKHNILLNILTILLLYTTRTICQPQFRDYNCDSSPDGGEVGTYTSTSPFKKNLDVLLTSMTSNTNVNYGFYNRSVGQNLDIVNGVALCRGDVPTLACKTCIANASAKITSVCPNQTSAIVWYDTCMLRYSSERIFKGEMSHPRYNRVTGGSSTDPVKFNQTVSSLMTRLANEAALGDSRRKFATGVANFSRSSVRVYGLAQCVPDLEDYDCLNCLTLITNYTLADCCYGKLGVEAAGATCGIRFGNQLFFGSAVALPPLPPSPPSSPPSLPPSLSPPSPMTVTRETGKCNASASGVMVVIVVALGVLSAILLTITFCLIIGQSATKRNYVIAHHHQTGGDQESEDVTTRESLLYDMATLRTATNDFSDENKLGQGGYGTVYKGTLPNGEEVAVKRLCKTSVQGVKEFKNEILLVAKLHHKNLAMLLGFALNQDEKLLVYEYVPNKSLDHFVFDPIKQGQLDWKSRYNIIQGIAKGMSYLHLDSGLKIIHRDLKAGNILLDANMNPKIADFGLARMFDYDKSQSLTSRVAGTFGYMSPEYVNGVYSTKSDVYSYGILVLEIICGKTNSAFPESNDDGDDLVTHALKLWQEGKSLSLVDPSIRDSCVSHEVTRCVHLGLLCVEEAVEARPTMATVVLTLESSNTISLPVPRQPGFFNKTAAIQESPYIGNVTDNDVDIAPLSNDVSVTEIEPR